MNKTQLTEITKYLNRSRKANPYPIFATINKDSRGRQFVLNGHNFILFKEYQSELEQFTQTPYEQSIKVENLIPNFSTIKAEIVEATSNDLIIWENVEKYKSFLKGISPLISKMEKSIYFLNQFFNSDFIRLAKTFIKRIDSNCKAYGNGKVSPLFLETNEVIVCLLPMRVESLGESSKVKERTTQFCESTKGE